MSYVNLPRTANPRGLGECFDGFGSWVVDRPWGLSPSIIPGQNRPYGTSIIQTHYPRAQTSRFLDMNRFVVAGGTWPQLLPANSPVFRTPVMNAGVMPRDTDIPPNMGLSGAAGGFGWIPQGVARPPYELLEPMKNGGYRGFGQEDVKVDAEVRAQFVRGINADAKAWISWHTAFKAWRYAIEAYQYLHTVTSSDATAAIDKQVFGSTAKRIEAQESLKRIEQTRTELIQSRVIEELGGVPPEVHSALELLLGEIVDTPGNLSGFGVMRAKPKTFKKIWETVRQSVWFDRTIYGLTIFAVVGTGLAAMSRWANKEELEASAAVRDVALGSKVAIEAMTALAAEDKKRLANASPEEAAAIIERSKLMAERINDINKSAAAALLAAKKVGGAGKTFWIWAAAVGGAAFLFYWAMPQFRGLKRGLYRWPAERRGMQAEIDKLGRSITYYKGRKPTKRKRKKAAGKPAKQAPKKKQGRVRGGPKQKRLPRATAKALPYKKRRGS